MRSNNFYKRNIFAFLSFFFCLIILFQSTFSQVSDESYQDSPISIELIQRREAHFATFVNDSHKGNRIGYRFFEHEPMAYGKVPLSNMEANIDNEIIDSLENDFKNSKHIVIHKEKIEKNEHWLKQDWTYYLKPVHDGIELLLVVSAYNEGLPEYYGVQQCFRMSGSDNIEWRKNIANTPAFSEYQLWKDQTEDNKRKSLTYVLRDDQWQAIPPGDSTVGARTPLGIAVDYLRNNGQLMAEVGPYHAKMLNPIDNGLITRIDLTGSWICGIYWQNTSHITNHHPADCLHSIINIGNIPPHSTKAFHGKIYWFKGNKTELLNHFKKDFIEKTVKNR